jgi:hypothetical protein
VRNLRKVALTFIYVIIPVLILAIGYLYFHNAEEHFTHEVFFKVLYFYYPALFSLQGFLIALTKTKLLLPLALNCLSYLLVIMIWLDFSAKIGSLLQYAVIWFLGFAVVKFFTGRVVVE